MWANEFHQKNKYYLNQAKVLELNLEIEVGFHHLQDSFFQDQDSVDFEEDILRKKR
jgi:hypothetical protein